MSYRAFFIGGPFDGQEQVAYTLAEHIFTEKLYPVHYESGTIDEMVYYTYQLVFMAGDRLLYSMYDAGDSLDRLWGKYAV